MKVYFLKALFICLGLWSATAAAIDIPAGFQQESVNVNGIKINVYKGGQGEPLLLIHGYAQSALMWYPVMNALKDKFTIIVPDMRGAGLSDAPATGYDKVTMASDMKGVLDHYGVSKARVVGHDIGLMVAYAFAAKYPSSTEKLVIMDAFIPGIPPGDEIYNSPDIWHFRFHGPYAEKIVKGRERIYFDALWEGFAAHPHSVPEDQKAYYIAQYSRPGRMKAGFSWFQAMPQDAKDNKVLSQTKLPFAVLALGGEKANGPALAQTVKLITDNAKSVIVKDCGHWMTEECPKETIKALTEFL